MQSPIRALQLEVRYREQTIAQLKENEQSDSHKNAIQKLEEINNEYKEAINILQTHADSAANATVGADQQKEGT